MDTYKRFKDENYINWLKTAESLYILRSNIRDFVENETETYHKSLQESVQGETCVFKCSLKKWTPSKKLPICDTCERWKNQIIHSLDGKGTLVHWNNCEPYLWPTEKWEVAKVFMPRGQKDHRRFDQFDISAILNFMSHCKHFKKFIQGQQLHKVINVRNTVMHSPDFRLDQDKTSTSIHDVLKLASLLEQHIPRLNQTISEKIKQFETDLENCPGQVSSGNLENIKLLDREQQALKDKIEFLTQCYEADQHAELKEELQGMKNFLDQNKDLLENLRPQVNRLNEIQDKVEKHDTDIDNLNDRVGNLEKVTHDPMFSSDPLKFKNHLIEETKKRKWPDPIFTEEQEASGYRGRVEVNGHIYEGSQVCNNKKSAHQEVAKKALLSLRSDFESTEEPSTSVATSTSSASTLFYGTVTVVINKEVCSEGHVKAEEATESVYRKLARQFGLNYFDGDHTCKTAVLEHFDRYGVQRPEENLHQRDDKTFCQLQIRRVFTYQDKDGSTTRKKAEQQAAKVALDKLSSFLNCSFTADTEENYKGFLKERLEALGMESPLYKTEKEKVSDEARGPTTSRDHLPVSSMQTGSDTQQDSVLSTKESIVQCPPPASSPSFMPRTTDVDMEDYTGTLFYGTVMVDFNTEVSSDGHVTKEEATESAYRKLAHQFGLKDLEGDHTFKATVLEHFDKCEVRRPEETFFHCNDKISCQLQLRETFTFCDPNGSTKRKKAEQQAAKLALQRLTGFLKCNFMADDENYKGLLKERLEALGMGSLDYATEQKKVTEKEEGPSTCRESPPISSTQTRLQESVNASFQPKDSVAAVQTLPTTHSDSAAVSLKRETQDTSASPVPGDVEMEDYAEINTVLALYHLKPPSLTVESISTDQNVSLDMDIILDNFTFQNSKEYTSKKDAIRKTYDLLGCALGICQPITEEKGTMLVKQDFSQKSLSHPKEDCVGTDKGKFTCCLKEIKYNLKYEGQGSTEAEAKLDALQKALQPLTLLFGYTNLPGSSSAKEYEEQINTLLRKAGQKEFTWSPRPNQHKVSVNLKFKDYTMESKSQKNKKENRNVLSKRILGLLGVDPEPQCPSLRNCLDEWFKQRNLQQPLFDDTEEAQGSKATFSVVMSCTHPNWEDSLETAKDMLVQELKKRFKYLTDLPEDN